jgi:hypothetical protein
MPIPQLGRGALEFRLVLRFDGETSVTDEIAILGARSVTFLTLNAHGSPPPFERDVTVKVAARASRG